MSSALNDDDNVDGGIKPLAAGDPTRIGPYVLLGRLGAGGMGRVFLARSEGGRTVAVKVVHEEHVSNAQFRARFRHEIDAARRVGERYTAPVLDADAEADLPWVATGYVPGLSLEQIVRRYGPLPVGSVHALADGLLHALQDIHSAGIVHRDLKPSNVMLTVEGTRVIDFGISRALETSVESLLTSTGLVVGSPGFMSPEQVRGQRAGAKSDVFTLGCVLMYAATGELPFGRGASNQHAVMFQIVEGEPALERIGDEALRAFVARCLAKRVDERPGVEELLEDPERVRPAVLAGAWLPPKVVARLARQAARLLDVEAVPEREARTPAGDTDRATVDLRPAEASGGAVAGAVIAPVADPVAGSAPGPVPGAPAGPERGPEPGPPAGGATAGSARSGRRRRLTIAVPAVFVVGVGGGTVALIQPFGGGAGTGAQASPPAASAPAVPGTPGGSPSGAAGSPIPGGPSPQNPTAPAPDGQVGGQVGGASTPGGAAAQGAAAGAGTPGGGAGTPGGAGGTGTGATKGTGSGPAAGGAGGGATPGGGSGATPGGSGAPGGGGSPSGGSSGGVGLPAYFVGSWTYKEQVNINRPVTVTIASSGAVRLISNTAMGHCENTAKVTSVASGGSRINIGAAAVDKSKSTGQFCAVLEASFFSKSEPAGLQHNVGPAHADGYYYQRS
ncbi:serine/threonine-protein kinase [Streptomyces antarcticus]|uniref:serine/threonine-protein kinase n=1 Tax=Streptomyces antarcticus TaxID=2996458 RepID=UPI00226F4912|nr:MULTISPECIES: serine/threonine-protein kinase [unclassified Streptomyces]MCY0942528.1 serine/threonine-protein kinase [Streptomyces sp. H34-AA3]MCZ4083782.1 serine/threonine-protein kinase [Streptomyces sp. H34-S5]